MAGWISSKLKVAETFLQQIDQQAAESLGKSEKPKSESFDDGFPVKSGSVSLKDQLKKKAPEKVVPDIDSHTHPRGNKLNAVEGPSSSRTSTVADSDWTELLSTSSPISPNERPSGILTLRTQNDLRKGGIATLGSPRRDKRSNGVKRSDLVSEKKVISDARLSNRKSLTEEVYGGLDKSNLVQKKPNETAAPLENGDNHLLEQKKDANVNLADEAKGKLEIYHEESNLKKNEFISQDGEAVSSTTDAFTDFKREEEGNLGKSTNVKARNTESSGSDGRSDSESGSASSSDSENEKERREKRRKKREQILAEERAAKAAEAIRERENIVARLEGEKQSLEKILDEREKQQAQEAAKLQANMMETMEAVELEKQKHSSTRMEALSRLAKLETTNVELARSLATMQRSFEIELNRVSEFRQQIETKDMALEELRRRMSKLHKNASSTSLIETSKQVKLEREILEAEYSFTCEKITQLQEKAMMLEQGIEMIRKDMEDPTEVEIELKKRLAMLTDHLIQKQAQVESLASEKATLLFRLEILTRLLDEHHSSAPSTDSGGRLDRDDLEAGSLDPQNLKLRPLLQHKIRSGGRQLGSILIQLDSIFSAGALFIRKNPKAQVWAVVYLICLHFWVLYILTSHSHSSDKSGSGAIISLENINKTGA
ncbi:golgin candidate 2 [Aristolochia californica]|uniref:golgin candidate 2 n=1 Tax=Aristolochia californica TaxID=171875 RepID=UPI0035E15B54